MLANKTFYKTTISNGSPLSTSSIGVLRLGKRNEAPTPLAGLAPFQLTRHSDAALLGGHTQTWRPATAHASLRGAPRALSQRCRCSSPWDQLDKAKHELIMGVGGRLQSELGQQYARAWAQQLPGQDSQRTCLRGRARDASPIREVPLLQDRVQSATQAGGPPTSELRSHHSRRSLNGQLTV